MGYDNIEFRTGDGGDGCPERAPFDAIMVTAAARNVPPALIDQLAPGGRMVIPVGADPLAQDLFLIEKDQGGGVHRRRLFPVAFVPLTGRAAGGRSGILMAGRDAAIFQPMVTIQLCRRDARISVPASFRGRGVVVRRLVACAGDRTHVVSSRSTG